MVDGGGTGLSETIFLWIMGTFVTICVGAIGHIYKRLGEMENQIENRMVRKIDEMRAEIRDQITNLGNDLRDLQSSRIQVASEMIRRAEFEKTIDRMIEEIRMVKGR